MTGVFTAPCHQLIFFVFEMDKEKILSGITDKLGKTSLSERTIDKYVELSPVAEGTEPDDGYFERAVSFLKAMQGQYDHDVKLFSEDFKKNYKPEGNGGGNGAGAENGNGGSDEIADLKKMLQAVEERLASGEVELKRSELMKRVRKAMVEKNCTDSYVLDKTLSGVELDVKKDVGVIVDDLMKRYDDELKACRGDGAAPRQNKNNHGGADSAVQRFFKQKAKKEGWSER